MLSTLDHDTQLITALWARLDDLATEQHRVFWARYMKGAIPFRGVPMAEVRSAVHAWWSADGPSALEISSQKALAFKLFEGVFCEDKLSGVLVFREIIFNNIELGDVAPLDPYNLAALPDAGSIPVEDREAFLTQTVAPLNATLDSLDAVVPGETP